MTISRSVQLIGLSLGAVATLILAVWACRAAADAIRELRTPEPDDLKKVRDAYRELGSRTTTAAIDFSQFLVRYQATNDTSELDKFRQSSTEFRNWISSQHTNGYGAKIVITYPTPLTIDFGPALDKIQEVLDTRMIAAPTNPKDGLSTCRQLMTLAAQADGRAESIEQFLSITSKWRTSYLRLVLISVAVLVGLVIWLTGSLYRIALIPLRMKLVETTAIMERQEKLAHFGELAAGLAHEIRNPLTAINARLYTLQKSLPAHSPASGDADVIHNEINRLDRIVKDFLKLARPAEPQWATVHARVLMEEVSRLLSPALHEQRTDLKLDVTVDTPFRADPQQLKQVLINLVQNAADAIGHDGTITLVARFALQKLRGLSQEVVILEINDTGPGITPEAQSHLFDLFYSTKDDGTGLGLPISARIVDQHGGEIQCQSQLGRGTTFSIVLPVRGAGHEA